MRLKFILGMLGLGVLGLLALSLSSPKGGITSTGQPGATAPGENDHPSELQLQEKTDPTGPAEPPQPQPRAIDHAKGETPQTGESDASVRDAKHEAYVEARTAELGNLSRKTDSASLEVLLSEVRNPDQEIRQAALDAISQSGNRSAIPALEEAAAQTEDSGEKQAIAEVIDFLKLPTLTEILRERSASNNIAPPNKP